MIHPSYKELIDKVNENCTEEDEKIVTSRYSIVLATSKRARQLIAGAEPKTACYGKKALSVAVDELDKGLIHILPESEEEIDSDNTLEAEVSAESEN